MSRGMDNYRNRITKYDFDEVDEKKEYIESDQHEEIINDIESKVNDIKDMLEKYDPKEESLSDILMALVKLSNNLY